MRYGIFGDVHANLPALRAVLDALGRDDVGAYVCVGDVVGYGADPEACVDLVRQLDPVIVAGNHDWGVADRLSLTYFNAPAREAIEWTRTVLPKGSLHWLERLELMRITGEITVSHATLHDPHLFDYLFSAYDAWLSFRHLTTPLGFVGHSHVPVTFFEGNPVAPSYETSLELADRRAIANVGSVGQPRDGNPDAAYGVYDAEAERLTIHRVAYDVDAAARSILEAGLPPILADRLRLGR